MGMVYFMVKQPPCRYRSYWLRQKCSQSFFTICSVNFFWPPETEVKKSWVVVYLPVWWFSRIGYYMQGGFFLERIQSLQRNLAKQSLALCQHEKTKADWVMTEIHVTLFLIQKRTRGNYIPRTVYQKQEELFKKWSFCQKKHTQGLKRCPCALPAPTHRSVQPFHFIPSSHLSFCSPSPLPRPTAPVVTSWHGPFSALSAQGIVAPYECETQPTLRSRPFSKPLCQDIPHIDSSCPPS